MRLPIWLVLCLAIFLVACRAHVDQVVAPSACEPGFEPRDGICVPCPAGTLPREGGGCGCFESFEYEASKGTCEPVLPAGECQPDKMPMLGKRECQPVGVGAAGGCLPGFVADGRGGCDAVLPKDACPPGKMAVPGETVCREVAPCGEGTWGDIADQAGALYVSKAYTGGGSDGSKARPYTTIQEAVEGAKIGGLVAIAEGVYIENLRLTKPLRLQGRCPAKVEVQGSSATEATVLVSAVGSVVVKGLSVTGPFVGIGVGRGNVEIEQVVVHDLGERGIYLQGRTTMVTLRGSLVERNHAAGIAVVGSKATIEATVVRDTLPQASDKMFGRGIYAHYDPTTKSASELAVRGSLLERNYEFGVFVQGSRANLEATVVRDTLPQQADKKLGQGIFAEADPTTKLAAELVVRGAVFQRNRDVGIAVVGSKATIEATVVRDTLPQASDKMFGRGIIAQVDPTTKAPADIVVRGTLVERNHDTGIYVLGSKATVESTVVRDTLPREADNTYGHGISAGADSATKVPSDLVVRGALVERNHQVGIVVSGSKVTVESTVVRDTLPQRAENQFGSGIIAQSDETTKLRAEIHVHGALVERNQTTGIYVQASQATIEATVVRDTLPHDVDKLFGDGLSVVGRPYGQRLFGASVLVRGSQISGSARVGIVAFGDSDVALGDTRLSCNLIDLARVAGEAFDPRFDTSVGGDVCGCGAANGCKVQSNDLKEMPPAEPVPQPGPVPAP